MKYKIFLKLNIKLEFGYNKMQTGVILTNKSKYIIQPHKYLSLDFELKICCCLLCYFLKANISKINY